jgi:MFS family permease
MSIRTCSIAPPRSNSRRLPPRHIRRGYCFFTDRAVGKASPSDYVPDPLQASAIGWYNATVDLSGLAASLAGGWLWDHAGHASVFIVGAVFAVIGAIAILTLIPAASTGGRAHT